MKSLHLIPSSNPTCDRCVSYEEARKWATTKLTVPPAAITSRTHQSSSKYPPCVGFLEYFLKVLYLCPCAWSCVPEVSTQARHQGGTRVHGHLATSSAKRLPSDLSYRNTARCASLVCVGGEKYVCCTMYVVRRKM